MRLLLAYTKSRDLAVRQRGSYSGALREYRERPFLCSHIAPIQQQIAASLLYIFSRLSRICHDTERCTRATGDRQQTIVWLS